MKKILLPVLVFSVIFGFSSVVGAQTESATDVEVVETTTETRPAPTQKEGFFPRVRALVPGQNEKNAEVRAEAEARMQQRQNDALLKKEEMLKKKETMLETRAENRAGATEERKEQMETRREEMKTKMEDRKAEIEAKRKEMVEKRVDARFEKVVTRLGATIVREEGIIEKVVSRIEKIKVEGGETAEAETLVAESKMHITEAKTALETMKTIVSGTGESETAIAKEKMDSIKTASEEVQKHIRNAHQSIMKTVGVLRGTSQLKTDSSVQ